MIKIQTGASNEEAKKIIRWALAFKENLYPGTELTEIQLSQAAYHCVQGDDAWEIASMINERR